MLEKTKINWLKILVVAILLFKVASAKNENIVTNIDSLENFEDGEVELFSYPGQDFAPDSWQIVNNITNNESQFSLKLYGNTWKVEEINQDTISTKTVWQISAYIDELSEIQGFGVKDSVHYLLYAIGGTEEVNPDFWVPDFQGAFSENQWNDYKLPIADDWLERFGYLPVIDGLVFINDQDSGIPGKIYFDDIFDITSSLPISPIVEIQFTKGNIYKNEDGQRNVDVQFTSTVADEDSFLHNYYWNFGDGSISIEQNPSHTFIVEDDHQYSVFLEVTDATNRWGSDIVKISVDEGETSFPIKMNFVGDIMFARRIENLINSSGIEALFNPTMEFLGNSANVTFANLECPLTNQGIPHPTKSVVFRALPSTVGGLSYAGIDAVTLANNHTIDYGLDGLMQTQQVLDEENILYFGAGENSFEAEKPIFISKKGVTFGIVGASDRTGQYNNAQPFLNASYNKPGFANLTNYNINKMVNSVRDVSDFVIFQMHSGREYAQNPFNMPISEILGEVEDYSPDNRFPSQKNIELRHQAIDAGADIVISHHPHIIQGFEVYNGKLIAHSLGNFIFDLDYPETFPTAILNAEINESGFNKFTITPIFIDNYIPVNAKGELGLYLLHDLAKKSKDLNTYLKVDRENVSAEIILDTNTIKREEDIISANTLLENVNDEWKSAPIKLERNGNISEIVSITPRRNWKFRIGRELFWFGNFEEEGSRLWEIDNSNEFYDDTEFYRGSRSFKQVRPTGFLPLNTNLKNKLKLYSADSYHTLYAHIKTENSNNSGLVIQFYDSRYNPTPLGSENLGREISGNSEWKFYYNEFSVPEFTNYINLRMRSESPNASEGETWFDDIGLIEWSEWIDLNLSSQIDYPNDFYWIQIKSEEEINSADVTYKEIRFSQVLTQQTETEDFPSKFELSQNYPNPFNPSTNIKFSIPLESELISSIQNVSLRVYNILGQEVAVLINKPMTAGNYEIQFDASSVSRRFSSGVYFYQLQIGNRFRKVKKMVLLK